MAGAPLLSRQVELLSTAMTLERKSPVCVLTYDTQTPAAVIECLSGRSGTYERIEDGIAWFRLSNYLPTGELLVERIQEAVPVAEWIFVHVGCSILPEPVLHLMKYIHDQDFDVPQIVVVGERGDVVGGDERLRELFFSVACLIDLTTPS